MHEQEIDSGYVLMIIGPLEGLMTISICTSKDTSLSATSGMVNFDLGTRGDVLYDGAMGFGMELLRSLRLLGEVSPAAGSSTAVFQLHISANLGELGRPLADIFRRKLMTLSNRPLDVDTIEEVIEGRVIEILQEARAKEAYFEVKHEADSPVRP